MSDLVNRCAECDCDKGGVYCNWIASTPQEYRKLIEKLERELAAEKALADRLSGRLERKQVWSWCDSDDQALAAHRKARGM